MECDNRQSLTGVVGIVSLTIGASEASLRAGPTSVTSLAMVLS
jgi:hypothetical protein